MDRMPTITPLSDDDEDAINRALKADPPIFKPVARRLKSYDAKQLREIARPSRQPWQPRRPKSAM